jgi:hypothetical protein
METRKPIVVIITPATLDRLNTTLAHVRIILVLIVIILQGSGVITLLQR